MSGLQYSRPDSIEQAVALLAGANGSGRVLAGGTNNALLASVAAYNVLVPALSALLARERNDLPAFYRAVKDLAGRSRDERRQILAAMVAKSPG